MATILLIDDEVLVRQSLGHTLTDGGHTVVFAGDGAEGLRQMHAVNPDLVITDIVMPDQEGLETIMELRKISATLPIIAISGGGRGGSLDFLTAASALGATTVLRKPFGGTALLEAVEACLNARAT
ncbi:response regulator [Dongia sedimenti]|uniref:Response regulator n=1 Tax=Dongia sedimenti TaxID=3064282 RepID=A0ABU0YIV2_9PROT|nr:response regulator [Rhodospirillaceae bacterium R-7]